MGGVAVPQRKEVTAKAEEAKRGSESSAFQGHDKALSCCAYQWEGHHWTALKEKTWRQSAILYSSGLDCHQGKPHPSCHREFARAIAYIVCLIVLCWNGLICISWAFTCKCVGLVYALHFYLLMCSGSGIRATSACAKYSWVAKGVSELQFLHYKTGIITYSKHIDLTVRTV